MLNITITEQTPHDMLRAIRAACNELLGEKSAGLTAPKAAERETLAAAFDKAVETVGAPTVALALLAEQAEDPLAPTVCAQGLNEPPAAPETDSAGHAWNAELHASTKAKNQDGTWKKRRNAGKDSKQEVEEMLAEEHSPAPAMPAAPPLPPAAPTAEPIMPKIFALITSQIVTINQAVEAAQAEGFADLGANGLGGAPVEKQLAVLRKLEAA